MHDSGDHGPWTVAVFADRCGMTVRNIRAYGTRGLLPPPVRQGRRALYDERHRQRALAIRQLLDDGMTLRAIAAAIRAHDSGRTGEVARDFTMSLARVLLVDPLVLGAAEADARFGGTDGRALAAALAAGSAVDLGDGQVLVRDPVGCAVLGRLVAAGFDHAALLGLAAAMRPGLAALAAPVRDRMGRPDLLVPDPAVRRQAMARHDDLVAYVVLTVLSGMTASPLGERGDREAGPPASRSPAAAGGQ